MTGQPSTTLHAEPHPLAGRTVVLNETAQDPIDAAVLPGAEYHVLDWADRRFGTPWRTVRYPVMGKYAMRAEFGLLPIDDEVVYGTTVGGGHHLVHASELGEVSS